LTKLSVNGPNAVRAGRRGLEDPAGAVVTLDPVRARLLAELAEPRSAAMLAERVGLSRQKVNYHLRALESHGLVRVAGEREPVAWLRELLSRFGVLP